MADLLPLCTICQPPRRHAAIDGHRYETQQQKPPETGKMNEDRPQHVPVSMLSPEERKARRLEQVRQAVARHRAKKRTKAAQQSVAA